MINMPANHDFVDFEDVESYINNFVEEDFLDRFLSEINNEDITWKDRYRKLMTIVNDAHYRS
ncbi:MAG TPA: hypothetical protein VK444_06450 [Methanobacteriaceae archaeon]|nr:hypothetical protein [Methanobacteriaceae archaeon]